MELLGYFLCASKTFENLGNFSEPTTPFCMPNSTYFKSLSAPDIANPFKVNFLSKISSWFNHFCPSGVGYLFYIAVFNSFVKVSAKICLFFSWIFFVVLKTSLCTLDSSSFTCLSSLSILYQTVPYAFI